MYQTNAKKKKKVWPSLLSLFLETIVEERWGKSECIKHFFFVSELHLIRCFHIT